MARRKTYDITDDQFDRAIEWLEDGGTKKGACDILGVSANKTMENLINEHLDRKRIDKEVRAKKRKLPVLKDELVGIISDYLSGSSLVELSESYYRSTETIKYHLSKSGAMLRTHNKIDPLNPPLLPDECVAYEFKPDQFVWAAKYGCIAQVKAKFKNAYRIRVWKDGTMEYAYQDSAELGDMSHIEALGVDLSKLLGSSLTNDEIAFTINKTLIEANKKKKAREA